MNHNNPKTRHDFLYLFEVTNGNPNGDPDAGNMPRMDPETMHGIVTDVAIKRKVRDFVAVSQKGADGKKIFIQSKQSLNSLIAEGVKASTDSDHRKAGEQAQAFMCRNYYDIRMFGAVLSTGKAERDVTEEDEPEEGKAKKAKKEKPINAGQVRGPMQVTFAKSMNPIVPMPVTITRQAATTDEDFQKKDGRTMGGKFAVPYGLYLAKGHYNPFLGAQTGASEEDLKTFWLALEKMFEFDRSAARGEMATRGLWVFTHDTELGNHPTHKLFELVQVKKKAGVEAPRSYADYEENVPAGPLPRALLHGDLPVHDKAKAKNPIGVTLTRLI